MALIHKINYQGKIYHFGYRVVTEDMKSLGLRKNPNILTYPFQEWLFLEPKQIQKGKQDWGGIWVTRTLGSSKALQKYMKKNIQFKPEFLNQ